MLSNVTMEESDMARIGENIYKRKDGRWEGRYLIGRKKDGKSKYRSIYGKSYDEVRSKMKFYKDETTVYSGKCELTVNLLFEEWVNAICNHVKESTMANYKMKYEKHLRPYFGNSVCDKITSIKVQEFITAKMQSGLSVKYVSDIVVILKSMFKYASQEYSIYNPISNVRMPRKKRAEVAILSKSQQKVLQNYIYFNQSNTTLGIALSLYTGLRIGELCSLKWSDIDLQKRILTVNRTIQRIRCDDRAAKTKLIITEPKSISSQRSIPIPNCLISFLQSLKKKKTDYVISGTSIPIEPRTMQYRFKIILKKANLPSVHFHALRHMFATNCVELGFDVKSLSEILGHSSVEITLNRYVHSSIQRKMEFMERLSFVS